MSMQNFIDNANFDLMSLSYCKEMYLNSYPKNRINNIIPYQIADNVDYEPLGVNGRSTLLYGWLNFGVSGGSYGLINDRGVDIILEASGGSQSVFGLFSTVRPVETFTFVGFRVDVVEFGYPAAPVYDFVFSTTISWRRSSGAGELVPVSNLVPAPAASLVGVVVKSNGEVTVYVTFEIPFNPSSGDVLTDVYVISPGLTIISAVHDADKWNISASFSGEINNTLELGQPVQVSVFKLNGVDNSVLDADVDFVSPSLRWEDGNTGSIYNHGVANFRRDFVRVKIKNLVVDTGIFLNDWVVPVGVTVISVAVVGGFYEVVIEYAGNVNAIYDFIFFLM